MLIRSRKRQLISQINMIPYIDVMLVLLVIFMVTSSISLYKIKVDLPGVNSKPNIVDTRSDFVVITVEKNGGLFLNINKKHFPSTNLDFIVNKIKAMHNNTKILVNGDKNAKYNHVIQLISSLNKLGVTSVGLITDVDRE